MSRVRRRVVMVITAAIVATMTFTGAASVAFAAQTGNPHAGGSGKFKGSHVSCKNGNAQKCPPHGGG